MRPKALDPARGVATGQNLQKLAESARGDDRTSTAAHCRNLGSSTRGGAAVRPAQQTKLFQGRRHAGPQTRRLMTALVKDAGDRRPTAGATADARKTWANQRRSGLRFQFKQPTPTNSRPVVERCRATDRSRKSVSGGLQRPQCGTCQRAGRREESRKLPRGSTLLAGTRAAKIRFAKTTEAADLPKYARGVH